MFTIYILFFFFSTELGKFAICFPFLALCVFHLYHCGLCILPSVPTVLRSSNAGAELVSGMNWCQILLMPFYGRMADHNLSWLWPFLRFLFYMCVCIYVCVLCSSKV